MQMNNNGIGTYPCIRAGPVQSSWKAPDPTSPSAHQSLQNFITSNQQRVPTRTPSVHKLDRADTGTYSHSYLPNCK